MKPVAVPVLFSDSDSVENEVGPINSIEEYIAKNDSNRQILDWKDFSSNEVTKLVQQISEIVLDIDYVIVQMKASEMLEIPSLTRIIGCNSICTIYKR